MPWWRFGQSDTPSEAPAGGSDASSPSDGSAAVWLKFDDCDAFGGQDVECLRNLDVDQCKAHCCSRGYGGFVLFRGSAYFRRHSGEELRTAKSRSAGSTLYVQVRTVPVVTAVPVPAAAASAEGTASAVPRPAEPEQLEPPAVPDSFPGLEALGTEHLQALQANTEALEDFIAGRPEMTALVQRLTDVRAENCRLARQVLAKGKELEHEEYELSKTRFAVDLRRDCVRKLKADLADLTVKNKGRPAALRDRLARAAAAADAEAEGFLERRLETEGRMDATALAEFRRQYLDRKMEKHRQLGLRESVGA